MDKRSNAALLLGRLGLGAIFLVSGLGKVTAWAGTAAYAAAKGVPASLLAGAVALEILGGLSLIAGLKARWGAVALLVFLVPVTLVFHGFWAYQGADAHLQSIQFMKNLSIAGGLLAVLGAGPGALSVDAWLSRSAPQAAARAGSPA